MRRRDFVLTGTALGGWAAMGLPRPAWAASAAQTAVEAAKQFSGTEISIVWEAGLQALDPNTFSGPKWKELTGISVKVIEVGTADMFTKILQEHRAGTGAYDALNVIPSWMPDLAQAGASANQATNPVAGPNGLQNYPVLATAMRNPSTAIETVTGALASAPNTTYRLDLYWGDACGSDGRGHAMFPMMKTYVTTGALGSVLFTATVPVPFASLPAGGISGTVTDPDGSTSEIGNCVAESMSDRIFMDGFE